MTDLLHDDLALAAATAGAPDVARALAADPFRLELPPLPAAAASQEVLRALSALYLAAHLEATGLADAADWLVRERAILRVPPATAARLEEHARQSAAGLGRAQRALLYERLFGLGPGAEADTAAANARFESLLAALCSALVAHGAPPGRGAEALRARVSRSALDVAASAGLAAAGTVTASVGPVTAMLRRAADLLSDPGIGALAGATGLWATLARLLGPDARDAGRLLERGRSGQRVLLWLAGALPALGERVGAGPPVDARVVGAAATWLQAHGLPAEGGSI